MLLGAIIFLLLTRTDFYWTAFILFFIAGITDYFDGYFARKYKAVSVMGEILDPIADKILMVINNIFINCNICISFKFLYCIYQLLYWFCFILLLERYGLVLLEILMQENLD